MIESCICPKPALSAASMEAMETPRREAALRSITTLARRPPSWRSVETSASSGKRCVGERELILRLAETAAGAQILRRHHRHRKAGNLGEFWPQTVDHLEARRRPLVSGL